MVGYGRKPRRDDVRREIWEVQGRRKDGKKGSATTSIAVRNKVKSEKHLEMNWRDRNENVFARPNRIRENAETAILRRGGAGPARKKKVVVYQ